MNSYLLHLAADSNHAFLYLIVGISLPFSPQGRGHLRRESDQLRRDRQQLDVLDASVAALHRFLHLRRRLDVLLRVRARAVL